MAKVRSPFVRLFSDVAATLMERMRRMNQPRVLVEIDVFDPEGRRAIRIIQR